ncbi:hypothetical protein D0T49_08630 [Paludibacter sp. 221]|uniref:hypothetical protein n=1 Tax=Paludibacter sp. 221 TaxID=2302939 RepID=UPI0013D5B017|nr:hypothetical protein [Paludibacter sp. 221]NDV47109.1 hypothetical protein [Paludibacter sp. 221]
MASRRKLKKTIHYITSELVTEMYVMSLFKKIEEEKLDNLVDKTINTKDEFISRVNHVDGKKDSKIVKSYFRKLRTDWLTAIENLVEEAKAL